MKNVKIILAVISLIGIGFVAGFYTHRYAAVKKVHKIREAVGPRGFERQLFKQLEVDQRQKEQLQPIVQSYGEKIGAIFRESRRARRSLVDSMHAEMKPILTEAQYEKLESFSRRFRGKNMLKKPKKRRLREKKPE